jgi:hypothetical protein
VLQGGSPIAEFVALTAEQMRERIIESGELSAKQLDAALELLKSPDFRAFGGAGSTRDEQWLMLPACPKVVSVIELEPTSASRR